MSLNPEIDSIHVREYLNYPSPTFRDRYLEWPMLRSMLVIRSTLVTGWSTFYWKDIRCIIAMTESNTIYIFSPPATQMPIMENMEFHLCLGSPAKMNVNTKQLVYTDTTTSMVVAQGSLKSICFSLTLSGNVFITRHPELFSL